MYTNILLPLAFDESEDTDAPLRVAKALSSADARITLLHVFDALPAYAISYVPDDMLQATRDGVRSKLEQKAAELPGGQAAITDGSPGRAITDYAVDHGTDLIVMASHRPGMGDVIWGSTAAFVVRHVPCAVHVLR